MLIEKEFRERLIEELDEAFSLICQGKTHDMGLEAAAEQMEEFLGMHLVKILVTILSEIENDVTKLSREMLDWREELEKRRKTREKRIEEAEEKDGR